MNVGTLIPGAAHASPEIDAQGVGRILGSGRDGVLTMIRLLQGW